MSSILAKTAQNIDLRKQNKLLYIKAIIVMSIFTFLFLGSEYLFDNMISLLTSEKKAVLAQNYVLGVSTAGFLLYPLFNRSLKKRCRTVCTLFFALLSVLCIFLILQHISYAATLIAGFVLFLLFGLLGSAVYYAAVCMIKADRYLARIVGISYMLGIMLQFANNNLVNREAAQAVILSIFLLLLVFLLVKTERVSSENNEQNGDKPVQEDTEKRKSGAGKRKNKAAAGILLVLLVVLMTSIFSTLDNAVTLVHAAGTVDIGQWPRILLALSGLAAGFVFDIKNRKFMSLIMFCVMMLSTICIIILSFGGSFLIGLTAFYVSAGFFAVFFTSSFMELSRYMKIPELWAGLGRAVNNIMAALIANVSLALLASGSSMTANIIVLILFVAVSIVTAAYVSQMKAITEKPVVNTAKDLNQKDKLQEFSNNFSFTARETEVFYRLVNTEDSIQAIAESLYISRRTLERCISSIYEKTGVKSRVGLIRIYK
ncbi:MAG: LuxR C-terminal-related transcriptional regulator [Acutalibacteraceae bacterium]